MAQIAEDEEIQKVLAHIYRKRPAAAGLFLVGVNNAGEKSSEWNISCNKNMGSSFFYL